MGNRILSVLGLIVFGLCGCPAPQPQPFDGLADQVATLASSVESEDRDAEAEAIAKALDAVADRAQRGEFADLISTMEAARSAVADALDEEARPAWHDWSGAVDLLLWSYHRDQHLLTPRDASRALRQIAIGLRRSGHDG